MEATWRNESSFRKEKRVERGTCRIVEVSKMNADGTLISCRMRELMGEEADADEEFWKQDFFQESESDAEFNENSSDGMSDECVKL